MYYVMENKTDVIICEDEAAVKHNESNGSGFKLVGTSDTKEGADKIANARCETFICPVCGDEHETEEEMRRCMDECAMQEARYWDSFS